MASSTPGGMIGKAERRELPPPSREKTWDKIFLWLAGTLSATILLKVGQVQYLEIVYFVHIFILLSRLSSREFVFSLVPAYWQLAKFYLAFAVTTFALSICALRYTFFFPDELSYLKYPVVITLTRILELSASVVALLYLATRITASVRAAKFVIRLYFWTGVASAVYAILTLPLSLAGIANLGTYEKGSRMRGFYNEGGPYGLYLISIFLVALVLLNLRWESRKRILLASIPLVIAFLGSRSKAAFVAVLVIFLINGLLAKSVVQRTLLVSAIGFFLVVAFQVVDMAKGLRTYQALSQAYERVSHQRSKDVNVVYGRVAGAFIVPRMIAAHPFIGIGWGNYALVRNDPEYRGASALVRMGDEPGLGLLGTTADLGIPLTLVLLFILLFPFLLLRRKKAPLHLANLALLQPVVHLFGGQLNLTYPWIVTSFALGLAYSPAFMNAGSAREQLLPGSTSSGRASEDASGLG